MPQGIALHLCQQHAMTSHERPEGLSCYSYTLLPSSCRLVAGRRGEFVLADGGMRGMIHKLDVVNLTDVKLPSGSS